jgi:hypothetical protein
MDHHYLPTLIATTRPPEIKKTGAAFGKKKAGSLLMVRFAVLCLLRPCLV